MKKKKMKTHWKILLPIFLIVTIFGLIAFFVRFDFLFSYSIIGDEIIKINLNDNFTDPGIKVTYLGENIDDRYVSVINNIDNKKVGSYEVIYEINYKNLSKKVSREVIVVDNIAPKIELKGNSSVDVFVGEAFVDPGIIATDNYDTESNLKIEKKDNIDSSKVGSYKVVYTVTDSSSNISTIERVVNYKEKIIVDGKQKVAVLNYHFFYDPTIGEQCNESICLKVSDFRKQLDYLKENNYKTLTIEEFRAWMYGEIDIPEKSVLITIDDGAMGTGAHNGNKLIPLLEEYKMHATLFLITGWWDISNYKSEYLDVESHTNNMHNSGKCSGVTRGAEMLCNSKEEVIADLKTSIEITNSKTAFCFPFYAYNNATVENVKEVGFKLAFVGGNKKVSRIDNKYLIPRYVIQKNTSLNSFINMIK